MSGLRRRLRRGGGVGRGPVRRDQLAIRYLEAHDLCVPVLIRLGAVHGRVAPLDELLGKLRREQPPLGEWTKLEARHADVDSHGMFCKPRVNGHPVVAAHGFAEPAADCADLFDVREIRDEKTELVTAETRVHRVIVGIRLLRHQIAVAHVRAQQHRHRFDDPIANHVAARVAYH